ncbi:beta-lactamase family protein [Kitasatospora sp. RB6PN24]|uniref:serine hydrolase domain-containing protein n=1 Tax=Kitasatospora humi TaxID=2893891 RepID=UPI001E3FC0D4|nr:serine hydrolase domain-containing protein [Kitasatospora humi]MCC9307920.1 beta-lactamase family protein [Kitasatospora humi]
MRNGTTGTIQRMLDRAVSTGGLPGILVEIHDADRQWFATAGVADTTTGRRRTPRDRFRIGSITKTFVATVLLQLAAEGRVDPDDTVERWLPGTAPAVTVRMLLNHTSGIFNYTDDLVALNSHETHTPESLVQIASAHPPAFAPGADWAYSNTNYVLVGKLVERIGGRALADEIAERITRPLGLTGTCLPRGSDPAIRGPHSRHYTKLFQTGPAAPVHDATELDPSVFWAAGGMISTAADLNRFFAALLGGRLLPAEQLRAMAGTRPTHGWLPHTSYGLGLSRLTLSSGTTLWGMGGALLGSWSYSYGSRDGTRRLTVNANGDWTDGGWDDPIGIFTELLEIWAG